jgi:hypothetical protein
MIMKPIPLLMNELRLKDEKLTKEMFDVVLDPNKMLNVLTKKLQLYNETEVALKESRNKLIVGFIYPVHFSESLLELYLHLYYKLGSIPLYSF